MIRDNSKQGSAVKIPSVGLIEVDSLGEMALQNDSVVIVVGPNDGGKSTFLRDVSEASTSGGDVRWIKRIVWDLGTKADYEAWVAAEFSVAPDTRFTIHKRSGEQMMSAIVEAFYEKHKASDPKFLVRLLDASTRITLANTTENTDVVTRQISHPYHGFFLRLGFGGRL